MKIHKNLLLFGVSAILLGACSGETTAVEETEADEVTTEDLLDKAEEKAVDVKFNNQTPGPIRFIDGVEDGIIYGDSENFIDIIGVSAGSEQIIVIYNDTVVDIVSTDSDGYFNYFSNGGDTKVPIVFATNSNAKLGDSFNPGTAENEVVISYIPKEEDNSDVFSIGETAYFASGIEITVVKVGLSDEKPNGEINNNFVRVDFTIDNQTSEPLDFNSHSIELYDGDRFKAELNSKSFYSESIAAGMKGNGSAYFDSVAEGPFTVIIGAATWQSE